MFMIAACVSNCVTFAFSGECVLPFELSRQSQARQVHMHLRFSPKNRVPGRQSPDTHRKRDGHNGRRWRPFCRYAGRRENIAAFSHGADGIAIPVAHKNSPGMRIALPHAGAFTRNDRKPFSGVDPLYSGRASKTQTSPSSGMRTRPESPSTSTNSRSPARLNRA